MIIDQIQKWAGYRFYSNLSEAEFYGFRETGYAADLVKALDRTYPAVYEQYDILLYFKLVQDTTPWNIPDLEKPVLLFIAGHESPELPEGIRHKAAIIFKQYLDPQLSLTYTTLYRIPVGPSSVFPDMALVPFSKRKYNVFFSGNLHRGRKDLYASLTGVRFLPFAFLHRCRKIVGTDFSSMFTQSVLTFSSRFHNGFSPAVYAGYLNDAKIVLCPYGVTETETMRHFEAMKQGCVIVSDVMPQTHYFEGAPFIIVPEWNGAKGQIQALLKDSALLEQKHRETVRWWQEKCSVAAVVEFITNKIQAVGMGA